MSIKTYRELITLPTFEDRVNYLRTNSEVGMDTFGFDRIFNQRFYHSTEWRRIRDEVIVRDCGCDLALKDYPILDHIYVHHMNPVTVADLQSNADIILNTDFLVCCSFSTHNLIHYGAKLTNMNTVIERKPNDTCPWKGGRLP